MFWAFRSLASQKAFWCLGFISFHLWPFTTNLSMLLSFLRKLHGTNLKPSQHDYAKKKIYFSIRHAHASRGVLNLERAIYSTLVHLDPSAEVPITPHLWKHSWRSGCRHHCGLQDRNIESRNLPANDWCFKIPGWILALLDIDPFKIVNKHQP